jgi:transcriptional regulator with XRE-family HTH domain
MHKMRYMPANPTINDATTRLLQELGERLRLARLRRGLSAQSVADAAGTTRVTLHRLEAGAPAATLGTLAKVMEALDLASDMVLLARDDRMARQQLDARLPARRAAQPPRAIRLLDLPHLREVAAWHLPEVDTTLSPQEVFNLYERNWRHIDPTKITGKEARLLKRLTQTVGKGVMLV